jgi:AAT family amino acid transporter/D-serine/D-alanine/glycine transporter
MPGAPLANWVVLGFLVLVSVMLARDPDTRVALYVAPVWFGILIVSYLSLRRGSVPAPQP